MKICPTCSRTYNDEAIAFCLYDGSVLTTDYDNAPPTQRVPVPRSTDPSASGPLHPDANSSSLSPPTVLSPQQQYRPWAEQQQPPPKQRAPEKKTRGKLWLALAGLVLVGGGIALGIALSQSMFSTTSVARLFDTDTDATHGSDKPTETSNTMLRPTPTPMPTPTPETPAAERLGLVGNWSGAINRTPASLVISSGQGNSFTGTKTQGAYQVAFVGTINPDTRQLTIKETRVLKGRPYSNGTGWSLGTENGTLSADGRKISGKGKDQYAPYSWAYTKK